MDDEYWLGSHNMDFRSILFNSEIGAWMDSPSGAIALSKAISEIDQYSVDWGGPEWKKLIAQNPKFTDFQNFFMRLSRAFHIHFLL